MGTKAENAVRREANIVKMEGQLKDWSTQLDGLVVGCLEAGAQGHDPYRLRLDTLRTRHDAVQTKLNEFHEAAGDGAAWGTFRGAIADDWTALEAGFKDLTQ